MITVVFFASLRERLRTEKVVLEFTNEQCVEHIIEALINTQEHFSVLKKEDVLTAVNHTLCGKEAAVKDGDEVAFFPPVTGG